jgi:ABC-type sugar transport system permease subunit
MAAQAETAVPGLKRSGRWREILRNRWAYVFVSPFYILWLVFGLGPFLFSLYMVFAKWQGLGPIEFIGISNFTYLFGPGGEAFWKSVLNGVILFFMYVPIMTFLAIVLAVILNSKKVRGYRFFRTLIFAPYVTSMIAAGFAFRLLLEQNGGLVNIALNTLGLPSVPWLETEMGAKVSLCLLVTWGWLGYNMVLMLAGLQTIPRELAEAALVDGASPVQAFFYITIPLLRPVILFSVILSTMGTFGHVYNTAFSNLRYGRASAMSYVYAALILVLCLLQMRYFGRQED